VTTLSTRQTIALVVLFVVTSLTFIALDNRRALDPLKIGLREAIAPATDAFSRVGRGRGNQGELARQLEQITRERDALMAENAQLKMQAAEIEKLQQMLDFRQKHQEWTLVSARVLNPDPTGLQKFVTIDKGAADGLQVGMAVVDPYYFVGLVSEVEERTAKVTLAIDASSVVGAQLLSNGADGIVYGRWQSGGRMEMAYVDRGVTVAPGEVIVTSNRLETRTSRVPGGLIIGKPDGPPITNNQSDTLAIRVLPAADFDNLSLVAVIIDDGQSGS
jgi:rod shape-determining protein MreC